MQPGCRLSQSVCRSAIGSWLGIFQAPRMMMLVAPVARTACDQGLHPGYLVGDSGASATIAPARPAGNAVAVAVRIGSLNKSKYRVVPLKCCYRGPESGGVIGIGHRRFLSARVVPGAPQCRRGCNDAHAIKRLDVVHNAAGRLCRSCWQPHLIASQQSHSTEADALIFH